MIDLLAAGAAIVVAWTTLFGVAFACVFLSRLARAASAGIVLACYTGLAATVLTILGTGWQGRVGVAGMALPCAIAVAVVILF